MNSTEIDEFHVPLRDEIDLNGSNSYEDISKASQDANYHLPYNGKRYTKKNEYFGLISVGLLIFITGIVAFSSFYSGSIYSILKY